METARYPAGALAPTRRFKPLPLLAVGMLISFLLILNGVLFRTYAIAMASPPMEAARQFGLPFILAEIGIIVFALRQGLDLGSLWNRWPKALQYCVILFVSSFWIGGVFYSQAGFLATVQNLIFLVHPLFALAVYHLAAPVDARGLRKVTLALGAGLLIFAAMTAFAFLNHPPLATMPNNEIIWQFIIPGFISVRLFGAFCGAIFCFLMVQIWLDEQLRSKRFWPYVWLTLCAAMMIWSGTRNALLGAVIALLVMMMLYRLRPMTLTSIAALVSSLAMASWLAVTLIPFNDPAFMLVAPADVASADNFTGGRVSYWTAIWTAYQSVPVFGAGPFASFWILPEGAATHVQPHNILLQFLLSWGLPATLAALATLAFATWRVHVIAFTHRTILPFLAMLDCLLVMSLFDGTFHFAQPLMLIMVSFGVIFSAAKVDDVKIQT